jgi:hypothetical protein
MDQLNKIIEGSAADTTVYVSKSIKGTKRYRNHTLRETVEYQKGFSTDEYIFNVEYLEKSSAQPKGFYHNLNENISAQMTLVGHSDNIDLTRDLMESPQKITRGKKNITLKKFLI